MRKRRKKSKMGFTFVVLLALLATFGASYAMWTENIQIHGTIGTMDDFNYLCLEGYWALDEISPSTTAPDLSMNQNDGTVYGATWTPGSGINGCLSFDGNDYVDCGNDASLDISIGSWGLWVNFAIKPSNAGHPMNPIAKAEQYWIHASSDDSIQAKITIGGTRYIATTGADFIVVDTWYHVFGTYDGSTLRLYLNGVEIDSNTAPTGDLDTTSNIFTIGTWSSLVDYFQGTLDEVKIYSCALSAGDILDEYDEGSPV